MFDSAAFIIRVFLLHMEAGQFANDIFDLFSKAEAYFIWVSNVGDNIEKLELGGFLQLGQVIIFHQLDKHTDSVLLLIRVLFFVKNLLNLVENILGAAMEESCTANFFFVLMVSRLE